MVGFELAYHWEEIKYDVTMDLTGIGCRDQYLRITKTTGACVNFQVACHLG